jgi:L-Ala-D/L-Glu epimerase
MTRAFEKLAIYRLRVPLYVPYRLAFGLVEFFDTIVAQAIDGEGNVGVGEATILTGYTDETIDDSWSAAKLLGGEIATVDLAKAWSEVRELARRFPFTATAFATAIEMMQKSPLLMVSSRTRVPLLGLLNAKDEPGIVAEFQQLLGKGYGTVKVKIGFDVEKDVRHVQIVQRVVQGRARIRIDANQGFSAEDGVRFVEALDPAGIELFEQPCAAGDWPAHLAVARASPVPMMLDESIYGLDDIDRAAEIAAAAYIKLKLMKFVTLADTVRAIEFIRSRGMTPVFGNGVACDIGCWMEACIAARYIENAGEMNGFLKARAPLLKETLSFEGDAIVLGPGYAPTFDLQGARAYLLDSLVCGTRAAAALGSVDVSQ